MSELALDHYSSTNVSLCHDGVGELEFLFDDFTEFFLT